MPLDGNSSSLIDAMIVRSLDKYLVVAYAVMEGDGWRGVYAATSKEEARQNPFNRPEVMTDELYPSEQLAEEAAAIEALLLANGLDNARYHAEPSAFAKASTVSAPKAAI